MEENIEKIPVPQSLDEAFRILDGITSEEDRKAILDGDDLHFGLGLWIRNEWFYGCENGENDALLRDMGRQGNGEDDEAMAGDAFPMLLIGGGDMFSGSLMDLYREHLSETNE